MEVKYKGIVATYTPHNKEKESEGILIVNHPNGVESTHIIKNWHYNRIFQYIESMHKLL